MKRKLVTWLFFIAVFLVAPTCHSAFTRKAASHAPLKQQEKQLKSKHLLKSCFFPMSYLNPNRVFLFAFLLICADGHEAITELSRTGYQRTHGTENDEVHDLRILGRAKAIYGGSNDIRRHPAKNGSGSSSLVKTNSFPLVVLRHVAVWLLICALLL